MERTIVIHTEEKEIEIPVKPSIAALTLYRSEFNSDLIRDLNKAYQSMHPNPFTDAMKRANIQPGSMSRDELANALLENLDYSLLDEEDALPDGETQITAMRIVWAMAKAANKGLKQFDEWCGSFDMLPIRSLIDRCNEIWATANKVTVDLKN